MLSRRTGLKRRRRTIKRIVTKHGYPLCTTKKDIYTINKELGEEETEEGYNIHIYSVLDNELLRIKRKTTTAKTVQSLEKAYINMYNWIKTSENVIFARICSDENLNPVAFIVVNNDINNNSTDKASKNNEVKKIFQEHGSLCNKSNIEYRMGKQIGMKEQMEESEDALYVGFNNKDIIIKKITGGGSPQSHSNNSKDIGKVFGDIYKEIKFSKKAGNIYVGPRILYSTICSDKYMKPVGYLVMERIKGHYLNKKEVQKESNNIHELIDKLYTARINHGDLHNRNIMKGTTISNPEERIWIIDYGDANLISEKDKSGPHYAVSCMSEKYKNGKMKIVYV